MGQGATEEELEPGLVKPGQDPQLARWRQTMSHPPQGLGPT